MYIRVNTGYEHKRVTDTNILNGPCTAPSESRFYVEVRSESFALGRSPAP